MIRRFLSRGLELAREAWEQHAPLALERATARLPRRLIRNCTGDDYMQRIYLLGQVDAKFPKNTRPVLGWLPFTLFAHDIAREDIEPEFHSHPYAWSWSFVLTGGYSEEYLLEDGGIASRVRKPGSILKFPESYLHRIDRLLDGRAWTLFLASERLGSWYFRRPTGVLVGSDEFIAERTAERRGAAVIAQRVPCARCLRPQASKADWAHMMSCEYSECRYGIDYCWGGQACEMAAAFQHEQALRVDTLGATTCD